MRNRNHHFLPLISGCGWAAVVNVMLPGSSKSSSQGHTRSDDNDQHNGLAIERVGVEIRGELMMVGWPTGFQVWEI